MEIKQETLEQLLEMAQDIRGYIQAENLDTEHKDLFFMAETLENKVAELVGDEQNNFTGVQADRVALAEIDSELFFDEISMDTKSWSYDYNDLEQNTKVFEYVKKYYPRELQALKNKGIDYIEVYYD